jgi:tetratricopeptide (TPR) repeat protein
MKPPLNYIIRFSWTLLLSGSVLIVTACTTVSPSMTQPATPDPTPEAPNFDQSAAAKELTVAQKMIDAGQYSQVLPRLLNVVNRYPSTPGGIQARYWTGLTYFKIGGMRDAYENFEEYLRLAPNGSYAESAKAYLDTLTNPDASGLYTPGQLATEIKAVQRQVEAQPEELAHQLKLADLLWKYGQYDKAGALYAEMLKERPGLAEDAIIRTRIERDADGSVVVLTPAEMVRREAQREPLVIFNTQSFKSGRELGYNSSLRNKVYNVTGQVVNRSNEPLSNVTINVTIYGFGSTVFEAKSFPIGRLNPKETRAFSVPFTRFDNIENVYRYECVGTYTR